MNKILILTVVMVAAISLIAAATTDIPTEAASVEVTTEPYTETPTTTELPVETIVTPVETEPPKQIYYNVNLSAEVQDVIFAECEKYGISPAIVIAMIERESNYKADAIGDKGRSWGLMQIQPQWHYKRMKKLGCTNLLDPIQNVEVGIDYLGELYIRYNDISKALVAYNRGSYNGVITSYAVEVIARANEVGL
jgi:hypothetical protein